MWTATSNNDYAAKHVGIRMHFFYQSEFQCELEIRTYKQARQMLEDWARLQIPPAEVKQYQELIKGYLGATVDDVSVDKEGQYSINGKRIAEI